MRPFLVKPASCLKGEAGLLGDKSIAHRAIILSSITAAITRIENFPASEDCLATVSAFRKLGVTINYTLNKKNNSAEVSVSGKGRYGLKKPKSAIFTGESGTTLRTILGVLAGQKFKAMLTAGGSLSKRPMLRVTRPLRMMGARITANRKNREEYPPITIKGGSLKGICYKMPVPSAQVKSAILLAGLYAKSKTRLIEGFKTRDHTERMLKLFKADINLKRNETVVKGGKELVSPGIIYIPADISSASFFMVLALICPKSKVVLKNVGLNPTRTGIIRVLKRMGADIRVTSQKLRVAKFEPMGDLSVRSSILKGTTVRKEEIPSLIDELPVLMVAGCFAKGKTVIKGVEELRVKETDRIRSMSLNLRKMGADIRVGKTAGCEEIIIGGVKELRGAEVKSFTDHRTAMSMIVAGLNARGATEIDDIGCINKSFPNFLDILKELVQPPPKW